MPGLAQHEGEVGPAALLIVGRLNRVAGVEPLLGARLGGGELRRGDADAVAAERLADARPIRIDEHAARVEEHGLNRHRFSLLLSAA
jgi:hypothetical protein